MNAGSIRKKQSIRGTVDAKQSEETYKYLHEDKCSICATPAVSKSCKGMVAKPNFLLLEGDGTPVMMKGTPKHYDLAS